MAGLIKQYGALDWPVYRSQFEALSKSIVSQQLSTKAAATIYARFEQSLEFNVIPSHVLRIADDHLRGTGLSRQKVIYLKELARHFDPYDGQDEHLELLDNVRIIEELTTIKGIGKWTAEMFLMFYMRREDIFPIDDLGIRLGMGQLYRLSPEEKDFRQRLTQIAERWKPYRSIACRYIWKYYEDVSRK